MGSLAVFEIRVFMGNCISGNWFAHKLELDLTTSGLCSAIIWP